MMRARVRFALGVALGDGHVVVFGLLSRRRERAMGVSEGSRASERTSGDDGAHPGRRRAASHNRPRTAGNFRGGPGAGDVCTTSPLALHIPEKSTTGSTAPTPPQVLMKFEMMPSTRGFIVPSSFNFLSHSRCLRASAILPSCSTGVTGLW